jgi:hypothetical protein
MKLLWFLTKARTIAKSHTALVIRICSIGDIGANPIESPGF